MTRLLYWFIWILGVPLALFFLLVDHEIGFTPNPGFGLGLGAVCGFMIFDGILESVDLPEYRHLGTLFILGATSFGGQAFWLAMAWQSPENGWIPAAFLSGGLATLVEMLHMGRKETADLRAELEELDPAEESA